MTRKLRIMLIVPGALTPPLQEQKAMSFGVREEGFRRQEQSAEFAASAASASPL